MSWLTPATARNASTAPPISAQRIAGRNGFLGVESKVMNIAHNVGMMTMATNSELDSVTMSVRGM